MSETPRAETSPHPGKRLLVIAGIFPPAGGAGALRLVKLLKYLPGCGWEVDVIAPQGGGGWHRDPSLEAEVDATVQRVGWGSGKPLGDRLRQAAKDPELDAPWSGALRGVMRVGRHLRDSLAFPDPQASWAALATAHAIRRTTQRRYDAVYASAPPYSTLLAAVGVAQAAEVPLVVELRDPWAGHATRSQTAAWRTPMDAWLEGQVLAHADSVVVVTPGLAGLLSDRHGERWLREAQVVTNGFDPDDFAAPEPVPATDDFELAYIGTLDGTVSPPDPLLRALRQTLQRQPTSRGRLKLRVVGGADVASSERIRVWGQRNGLRQVVEVEPFTSHADAIRRMRRADALALSIAPVADWVLTSKVFEYLASGRPILAAVPSGDCRNLLQRTGGAVLALPDDPAPLVHALELGLRGQRVPVDPRQQTVIDTYSHARLAERLASVLDSAAR